MYAKTLIEYEVKSLDHVFTYIIPENLKEKLYPGMKVKVPFGNKLINGLVLEICNEYDSEYELKEIAEIIDEEFCFDKELLEVGKYLHNTTLCNLVTAYKAMLPTSLKIKEKKKDYNKYEKYVTLNINTEEIKLFLEENKRVKKQCEIIKLLENEKEILASSIPSHIINILKEKNIIKIIEKQCYRLGKIDKSFQNVFSLSEEQKETFFKIKNCLNEYKTHLIYGVTASGKTEVYFRLIEEVLRLNKTAMVLVPEITLTSQMIKRFYERFGDCVAIYHSGLSNGERNDEYLKIYRKEVKIVVGTRSSVFMPLKDLGIIIIDEEHSDNFKQDSNPRYNAIDIAKFRAKYHKIPLVLGSATPQLESMARAKKGIYELHTMKNRINNAKLPSVELINMTEEIKKGNSIISEKLFWEIGESLKRNEQIILLLNRRGYSPYIMCNNCGFTYKCKNCDITLTYHKSSNNLRCHYCGFTVFSKEECPECHDKSLTYYGLGTEKLEDYLKEKFPSANIVRMDVDTTSKKGSHEKILEDFKNHKYDILIGTQMISKGLDFPRVTLVGVINADTSLNIPDFRSSERTFSLLDQVAGRAGRSNLEGKVLIQTYNPDNYILNCVVNHDYDKFYNYETDIRRKLDYPPYYFLTSVKIISKNYEEASKEAKKTYIFLKEHLDKETIILGPTTALIFKQNNLYRFQIVLKYKQDKRLKDTLMELNYLYKTNSKTYLEIDNNPLKI
ncbi:MAG: primosomal protein N' [Bacilli bacterium]|nr:primosomal protein N' [Bacilli bacterium]